MSSLWGKVSEKVGANNFQRIREAVGLAESQNNIEELLSRCQMRLALSLPQSISVVKSETPQSVSTVDAVQISDSLNIKTFVKAAEEVIRDECRQALETKATEVHEDFLRRLVRRGPRRPRVNLFTTNYDLCFETAAARTGMPVIDGFAFSVPPRFNPEIFDYDIVTNSSYSKEPDFVPRLLRLFKLHGSVDWHMQDAAVIKKGDTDSPVLIYPRAGKYAASYSQPFLEVISRLQGFLRQRNLGILSVCCGFNDLHIAEPVLSAVKSNASMRMVVCAPDLCDKDARDLYGDSHVEGATKTNPALRQLDYLIDNGDSRITLINGFFPDLARLMPTVAAQTDAEQHEARIKKLEEDMAKVKSNSGAGL
jgi:hypothetical protein